MFGRKLATLTVGGIVAVATFYADMVSVKAEYPDRPIKVIVGFRAGGATDTLSKLFTKPLGPILGQPVVTTTVSGGGGAIGTAQAARSKADGYTLVVGSNGTMTVSPQTRNTGYTHENFISLGRMAAVPTGWAVRADSPIKTMQDLVAHVKKNPKTNYTSVGTGSSVHLTAALWADAAGIKLNHIGNRGGRGAIVKLLSKEVDFIVVSATNFPARLKKGKSDLRPLAVSTAKRWSYAPTVPTVTETGVNQTAASWWGLFAPKGTPAAAVAKLRAAVKKVGTSPEMAATLKKFYYTPAYANEAAMAKIIAADLATNKKGLAFLGRLKK
jgi:tripartite-type tricarboxylate transporter receptor subunit TctC